VGGEKSYRIEHSGFIPKKPPWQRNTRERGGKKREPRVGILIENCGGGVSVPWENMIPGGVQNS